MEVLLLGAFFLVLLAAAPAKAAAPREIHSEPRLIAISHVRPPPPKPTPPIADVPPEILAGGVPLEEGWRTVGWYSYLDRQFWIRVDQQDPGPPGPAANVILPPIDRWQVAGWLYRWTVIAGDATPLATEEVEEDFTLEGPPVEMNPEFAYKLVMAEVWRFIAREASDWIDDNVAVGGKAPPSTHALGSTMEHIESRRPRPKIGAKL